MPWSAEMRSGFTAPDYSVSDDETRGWRLLTVAAYGAGTVTFGFFVAAAFGSLYTLAAVQFAAAVLFFCVPKLRRFGTLTGAVAFGAIGMVTLCVLTVDVGTASGLTFYFPVMAAAMPMVVGVRRVVAIVVLLAVSVTAVIVLHFTVPGNTGLGPDWLMNGGFVANVIFSALLALAIVGYGLYEISRTEAALEEQYRRSEALLDNILPRGVADRLKGPGHHEVADAYDDASILFADIAGFTALSSDRPPTEVVRFLDRLYSGLDELADRHRLEKIKTTGDSYMVVSGVPEPRPDHLSALARFAIEMRDLCRDMPTEAGDEVQLRIGLACGPVVAGVVGSRKFFYDVWGDAVNLASRMESTGVVGRIQVTGEARSRLCSEFEFEERGVVQVKGKADQFTWFLVGERLPH